LESIHWSDGRELKIIDRGKIYRYKGQTVYGIDTYTIPISNIAGVAWESDPKNAAVLNLILKVGGSHVSFAFIRDNPSIRSYARFLAALPRSLEGTDLPDDFEMPIISQIS
jgi:hypothetical protein